jgi:hypothetical protein
VSGVRRHSVRRSVTWLSIRTIATSRTRICVVRGVPSRTIVKPVLQKTTFVSCNVHAAFTWDAPTVSLREMMTDAVVCVIFAVRKMMILCICADDASKNRGTSIKQPVAYKAVLTATKIINWSAVNVIALSNKTK